MKLHDLSPAEGSRKPRTRVGRGIAAGKGKTAGRGTKGQKSRTGHGSLPPWFEGGQTPIHVRIPKLRGFRNRFRLEYEVVNVGRISALADTGILDAPAIDDDAEGPKKSKSAKPMPVTVTPDILAAAGLIRTLDKPLKVLGQGDVTRPLFIIADAFSASARTKIEAVGGTAQVLEFPGSPSESETDAEGKSDEPSKPSKPSKASKASKASAASGPDAAGETPSQQTPADEAESEA
jgi:large subunit ribosomal protein L15